MHDPGGNASTTNRPSNPGRGDGTGISRRAALAAVGAGLSTATAGCIREFRSAANRDGVDALSLTITTVPADGDRESIRLAREIATALEAAGIDVDLDMRSNEEFLRSVLINHDFDVYVGRHPGGTDPDFLYEALHSLYADESGWQNPFGFTNLLVDDQLEQQREADGDDRDAAVEQLLESLSVEQPFVPICRPIEHRLVSTGRFDAWEDGHLATRSGYLGLESHGDGDRLRAVHTDARPSENVNPLNAEYRDRGTIADLVYDSLAVELVDADGDGSLEPWLAADWEWDDETTLSVDLRADLSFHDGEPLTAADVAFTYQFLEDTSLGSGPAPAPSPRFRGLSTAIEDVTVLDEERLEFAVTTGQAVAERALTVPILPEHVWTDRASEATVRGVRIALGTTEALVTDNVPAIGSGPYRFESRTEREHVTLERFDDHVTRRDDVDLPAPTAGELRVQIDPRSTSAIQIVEDGNADVTSQPLETYVIDDVDEQDDTRLVESPSWAFYHLGFNARQAPFSNPRFRQVVARLIDREWLAEEVFHGYAEPIATPVTDAWTPEALAWNGEDPQQPFLGSDGEVDREAARDAFEAAGFRYDGDGALRVRR